MSDRPRRWFPLAATFAIAVLLLVAAIVILPHPGKTATTTPAATTTATDLETNGTVLSTSDYNSSLGIRLTLSVAQSTPQNDGVSMNVSLYNTLATLNNLSASQEGLTAFGLGVANQNLKPCSGLPIGVEIFQGNYVSGNLSHGEPLTLFFPGIPNCPTSTGYQLSFAPLSDNITSPININPTNRASANVAYWGYWTDQGGEAFRSFSPGVYTMEGEDWWGQVTVLHFQVVDDQNPLDCATIASNSSFVGYTNGSAGIGPLKLETYYQNPRTSNTVVLALSNTGDTMVGLLSYDTSSLHFGSAYYQFSPDGSQIQSWRYYAPNGTLSYPAFFYPNQCVLISVTLSTLFPQVPLTIGFTGTLTQTFTFSP